jgi:hypothetical protein
MLLFGLYALQLFQTTRAAASCAKGQSVMKLNMLPSTGSPPMGAACLDGSPTGYYIEKTTNISHANDWQLYFQGGGWCYSEIDCYGRSKTTLGSSKAWPKSQCLGGPLAADCEANPLFCQYNRVYLAYCDGNSFASNRADAVNVTGTAVPPGTQIFWRGKANIAATLNDLLTKHNLGNAVNVLESGGSAGGLAAYLHADSVHDWFVAHAPNLKKYKSAPISGFFLDHNNVLGNPVYETMMKYLFEASNAVSGVNQNCIAATPNKDDQWRCNFASHAYAHTKAPIFPLNSALDSWQTGCIYTATLDPGFPSSTPKKLDEHGNCANAAAPFNGSACAGKPRADCLGPWSNCSKSTEECNAPQLTAMNQYITDFKSAMTSAVPAFTKEGNGAFIHSCHKHCAEQDTSKFTTVALNGVTMRDAFNAWWQSDGTEPAAKHTHLEMCTYTQGQRACNPTCGK